MRGAVEGLLLGLHGGTRVQLWQDFALATERHQKDASPKPSNWTPTKHFWIARSRFNDSLAVG